MIPLPEGIAASDMRQWLANGFFWWREPKTGLRVGKLAGNPDTNARGDIFLPVEDAETGMLHAVDPTDVFVAWPLLGASNVPNRRFAIYVSRAPSRQYARTYLPDLLTVTTPRIWDIARADSRQIAGVSASSPLVARAMFNPEFTDLSTGLTLLSNGQIYSFALDRRTIIVGDAGKRIVYYNGLAVGTYYLGEFIPHCDDRIAALVQKRFNMAR